MFNEVEATFDVDASSGRLTCVASGEPAPVLYWIQPSGKATRYSAPASTPDTLHDDQLGLTEAVLQLDTDGQTGHHADASQSGMYICVADNDAGNATLTVSLPAPNPPLAGPAFTRSHATQVAVIRLQPSSVRSADLCFTQSCNSRVKRASHRAYIRSLRSGPYGQCVRSPQNRGCFFFAGIAEMLILRMLKTI